MKKYAIGWYVAFVALAAAIFVVVHHFTGYDAIGAASRFLWNALAFLVNSLIRLFGGLTLVLAKGVGLRRVSRLATMLTGVGLGYAGSVILSDERLRQAHGWRGKLKAAVTLARNRWQRLHLVWKLAIVAVLIASQLYLHALLIIFPIAFLVPVIRRLWIQIADFLFGGWYWHRFGRTHRAATASLETMPGIRHIIAATRLARLRYLCAWRLWKYDPAYRRADSNARLIDFAEPLRLWWRGDLDRYVGRPLLSGRKAPRLLASALDQPSAPPPLTTSFTPSPRQ